jgi:hypothetical protein
MKLSYISDKIGTFVNGEILDASHINTIIEYTDNVISNINNNKNIGGSIERSEIYDLINNIEFKIADAEFKIYDAIDYEIADTEFKIYNKIYNLKVPAILNNIKSTLYYNSNEYMKVDYRGTIKYDTSENKYVYSSDWITQHMYYDDDLSTFIPNLPYQDPFKAIITLKMPLAFDNYGWAKQQLIMCQDFVLGDGQDDHSAMCPKWYNFNGMEWGGSMLNGSVVRYIANKSNLAIYTNTDIDITFGTNSVTPYKYLTVFIYPLIKITDPNGHIYSPLLISYLDSDKTKMNERFGWILNTADISTLDRNITNTNYKQNISLFLQDHIKQINMTFFGNDGINLPSSESMLKSNRLQSWNNNGKEGVVTSLPAVIKNIFDGNCKIELSTIDADGYLVSCGTASNYSELQNNYNKYKTYRDQNTVDEYSAEYPWLY